MKSFQKSTNPTATFIVQTRRNRQSDFILRFLVILWMAVGCAHKDPGDGSAAIGIKISHLDIEDVETITVTISGSDIEPEMVVNLSRDSANGWSGVIDNIPAGEKRTFLAQAFDGVNSLIYSGSATNVTILNGETVYISIYLQPVDEPEPFDNTVPRFDALVISDTHVAPNSMVIITASASDPDGDAIDYAWRSDQGNFSSPNSASTSWTSPATEGLYELTVSASDPQNAAAVISLYINVQSETALGKAEVTIDINTWPEVSGLVPNPTRIEIGQSTHLSLDTIDPDGDALSFSWSAGCTGTFDDPQAENPVFTLSADNDNADCSLRVTIDDNRGGSNHATIVVATGPGIEPDTDADTDSNTDVDTDVDTDADTDTQEDTDTDTEEDTDTEADTDSDTHSDTDADTDSTAAILVINELSAAIPSGCDLVELRAISGGGVTGITLRERTAAVFTFGNTRVETNDLILIHFDSGDTTNCNIGNAGDETSIKDEYPVAAFPGNVDTAWDVYTADTGLTATTNVLILYDALGNIMDGVLLTNSQTGTAAGESESQAENLAASGEWTTIDGTIPAGGFVDDDFCSNAVFDLGASNHTTSLQRNGNDDANHLGDWAQTTSSWGALNAGQSR